MRIMELDYLTEYRILRKVMGRNPILFMNYKKFGDLRMREVWVADGEDITPIVRALLMDGAHWPGGISAERQVLHDREEKERRKKMRKQPVQLELTFPS